MKFEFLNNLSFIFLLSFFFMVLFIFLLLNTDIKVTLLLIWDTLFTTGIAPPKKLSLLIVFEERCSLLMVVLKVQHICMYQQ